MYNQVEMSLVMKSSEVLSQELGCKVSQATTKITKKMKKNTDLHASLLNQNLLLIITKRLNVM